MGGRSCKLTKDDLDFIVNHTAASKDNVEKKFKEFQRKYPDGKIRDASIIAAEMKVFFPQKQPLDRFFDVIDTNNDGVIDFKEFMVFFYLICEGNVQAKLKQVFRLFDIDRDGSISPKEMHSILHYLIYLTCYTVPKKKSGQGLNDLANKAFAQMDTDSDGKISESDFVQGCLENGIISEIIQDFLNVFKAKPTPSKN